MLNKLIKSQEGIVILPVLVLIAAISGILIGTVAVQRSTVSKAQVPSGTLSDCTDTNVFNQSPGITSFTSQQSDNDKTYKMKLEWKALKSSDDDKYKLVQYRTQYRTDAFPGGKYIGNNRFYTFSNSTTSHTLSIDSSDISVGDEVWGLIRAIYQYNDDKGIENYCHSKINQLSTIISGQAPTNTPSPTSSVTPTLTPTSTPSLTPIECDNTNPNYLCDGDLQVWAFLEKEQNKCDGFFSSIDKKITALNSAHSKFSFTDFNGDKLKKTMNNAGSIGFHNIKYIPNSDQYNDTATLVYHYPEWIRMGNVYVSLDPCNNIRVGGKDAKVNKSARTITLDIEPDDFGSVEGNLSIPFRFTQEAIITLTPSGGPTSTPSPSPSPTPSPSPSPSPTPSPSPSPSPTPSQCPANPPRTALQDCGEFYRYYTTIAPIKINLDEFTLGNNSRLTVTWPSISEIFEYRIGVWFFIEGEDKKGVLAGWPNIISIKEDSNDSSGQPRSKTITFADFNNDAENEIGFSAIKKALEEGKEVKLQAVVRAIYHSTTEPNIPIKGGGKGCTCRSQINESSKETIPPIEITPTSTPNQNGHTYQLDIQDSSKTGDTRQCWIIWREGPNGEDPRDLTPSMQRCSAKGDRSNVSADCENIGMGTNDDWDCGFATPLLDSENKLIGIKTAISFKSNPADKIKFIGEVCNNLEEQCNNSSSSNIWHDYGDSGDGLINDPLAPTDKFECTLNISSDKMGKNITCKKIKGTGIGESPTPTTSPTTSPGAPTATPTPSPTSTPQPTNTPIPTLTPTLTPTPTPRPEIAVEVNFVDNVVSAFALDPSPFNFTRFTAFLCSDTDCKKTKDSHRGDIPYPIGSSPPTYTGSYRTNFVFTNPYEGGNYIKISVDGYSNGGIAFGERSLVQCISDTPTQSGGGIVFNSITYNSDGTIDCGTWNLLNSQQNLQYRTDVNRDGTIRANDYDLIVRSYGKTCPDQQTLQIEDVNFDCRVNGIDLSYVISRIGESTTSNTKSQQRTKIHLLPNATPTPAKSSLLRKFFPFL